MLTAESLKVFFKPALDGIKRDAEVGLRANYPKIFLS